jgi:manganese/zinc/iron transport system ATP- binding protein
MKAEEKVSEWALETHDLSVAYHKKPVLYGVDLAIPKGQLVGIVGPNGAGKSTLIKAVMGLLPIRSGWVEVFGQPFKKTKTRVGYVPQRESVDWDFPVNVMDVVMIYTTNKNYTTVINVGNIIYVLHVEYVKRNII